MFSKGKVWMAIVWWFAATSVIVFGETRKAGLWEIRTNTTWQRAPFEMTAREDPSSLGTRTHNVCLSQEMIDKYGVLLPQSRGQCKIEDKVMKPGGSTAKYVCSGRMSGSGTLETDWSDPDHSTGRLHFVGTLQQRGETVPVEWTTLSSSVFKSASCGDVKPLQPTPAK